jgi:molybdopterin converting factor small subunit
MIAVKVKYFQLSREVEEKEEVFALHAGSHYNDLRREIIMKHPSLTYTVTMALTDGAPVSLDVELKDGDEVDLLASPAGG